MFEFIILDYFLDVSKRKSLYYLHYLVFIFIPPRKRSVFYRNLLMNNYRIKNQVVCVFFEIHIQRMIFILMICQMLGQIEYETPQLDHMYEQYDYLY
jgi:hypothetical protein